MKQGLQKSKSNETNASILKIMYTHNNTEFVICYNFGLEIKKRKKKQRRNKT